MTIVAKFPGRCGCCGGTVAVGDRIEWTKGAPAVHVACALKPARKPPRRTSAARRPSFPMEAPETGAVLLSGRRDGRGDSRYTVGQTVHAPKVAELGGGPDGHYYTVLAAAMRPPCEDNGQYTWQEEAWVRPATETEAAPVAQAVAARVERESLARELGALRGERVSVAMPPTAVQLVPRTAGSLAASGERIAVVDGMVLHQRAGDPDRCDSWYHYVVRLDVSPELLSRVEAFAVAAGGAR